MLLGTFLASPSSLAPAEPPFCFLIGVLHGSRPVLHLPATLSFWLAVLPLRTIWASEGNRTEMMLGPCRLLLNPSGAAAAAAAAALPGRARAALLVAFASGDVGTERGHGPELGGGGWWVLDGHPSSLPRGSPQSSRKPQIQGPALLLPLRI